MSGIDSATLRALRDEPSWPSARRPAESPPRASSGADDPMWAAPDGPKRRLALGHQDEPEVPGYCTCGALTTRCRARPRRWAALG